MKMLEPSDVDGHLPFQIATRPVILDCQPPETPKLVLQKYHECCSNRNVSVKKTSTCSVIHPSEK
jgi:hypothetical protein